MTYFQNEVWDTGGDGRISIRGDIYSTANPFSIFVGPSAVKCVEFSPTGMNVIGALTVNGNPIGGAVTEDLIPGAFGANTTLNPFTFRTNLNINTTNDFGLDITGTSAGVFSVSMVPGAVALIMESTLGIIPMGLEIGFDQSTNDALFITSPGKFKFGQDILSNGNVEASSNVLGDTFIFKDTSFGNTDSRLQIGNNRSTTVGAAGGASALPATPLGYIHGHVGMTPIRIPYYSA